MSRGCCRHRPPSSGFFCSHRGARCAQVNSTDTARFKANFLRIQNHTCLGSPDDGVIMPWSSSQYGFVTPNLTHIPLEAQPIFTDDLFGLATLYKTNRLYRVTAPNVPHTGWIDDQNLFTEYILPVLD